MITLVSFLDRLAPGLYLLLGAAFAWNLWKARRTSIQYRATYFELEREVTRVRRLNALTVLVVVAMIGFVLLGIQKSMLPFLRQVQGLQAMQQEVASVMIDGSFVSSTPRSPDTAALDIRPVDSLGGDSSVVIIATPTPTPDPVGTIIPNPPPTQGCTDPRAQLILPANGMRVFQPIAVEGSAFADNFSSARIEISGPQTGNTYAVLDEKLQPIMSLGAISQISPAGYEPGLYQLRLMVFDNTQLPVASCMVNIYISEPPATSTPKPAPST